MEVTMAKLQHRTPPRILQLKITLMDSEPAIWRRVLVADQITLYQLHQVIQIIMGWTNSHLHLFDIDDKLYSLPEFGLDDWGEPVANERRTRLFAFDWKSQKRFRYDYDFGDNWRHEVVVEKLSQIEEGVRYPKCIGGERACPPEDVGGISGYGDFLQAIGDPMDEEHESTLMWVGGAFNPEFFSRDDANAKLWKTFRK
ncbi:MAG: plasmid pRiA4b ORF-3 family protein [Acidobacteriota bacterium]